MWGQSSASAWSTISSHTVQWCVSLKLLWWTADYSFVQRSTLATGLSLALAGLTLVGLGEWAERVDSHSADGRSGANLESSDYSRPPLTLSPSRVPDLPDGS